MSQDNTFRTLLQQKVAFYKPHNYTKYDYELSLGEIFEMIRSNKSAKALTLKIREDHKEGIAENFKTIDKNQYQKDKQNFSSFIGSGLIDRNAKEISQITGIVIADLDNNLLLRLKRFYKNPPYFTLAYGMSVSGFPNGFAVFATTAKTVDEFNHFAKAIQVHLQKNYGIGIMQPDIKRIRYIAHDPNLWLNENVQYMDEKEAGQLVREEEQRKVAEDQEADQINETEWVPFCERYAQIKGYKPERGHRHMYGVYFSIAANLLGISKAKCNDELKKKDIAGTTNFVDYPYSKYKDSHGRWKWRLFKNKKEETLKEYVLNQSQFLNDLDLDLTNKIIYADTGIGKTFTAIQQFKKLVIAVPYHALRQNIAAEYNIFAYSSGVKMDKIPEQIVTTYASLRALVRKLGFHCEDYHFVVDEAHNLTLSAARGFMLEHVTYVMECLDLFKSYTLLSGTWLHNIHPVIRKMEVVRVRKPRLKKKLYYVDCENVLKSAIDLIRQSIENDRFPFVLQNNRGEQRQSLLASLDKIDSKGITSRDKEDEVFVEITQKSIINKAIQCLVTTTVLKEGNNINNPYHFDIIILGNYHSSEIEQVSQRFRKAKSIHIYILRGNNRTRIDYFTSVEQLTWDFFRMALKEREYIGSITRSEERFRHLFSYFPFQIKNDRVELDYLILSFLGIKRETIYEGQNEKLQLRNLQQYGIEYQETINMSGKLIATDEIKQMRESNKEYKQDNYNEMIALLRLKHNPVKDAKEMKIKQSHKLRDGEDIALNWFLRFAKYQPPTICLDLMSTVDAVNNRLAKVEMFLIYNQVYHVADRNGNDRVVGFLDGLTGVEYIEKDERAVAQKIVELGKEFQINVDKIAMELDKEKFTYTKKIIQTMFEVERKQIGNERKRYLIPKKRLGTSLDSQKSISKLLSSLF